MTPFRYATRILTKREHYAADYALVLRQEHTDGTAVVAQVRRVVPNSGEELQIEITTYEQQKGGRVVQRHTSLILPPEFADAFAEACAKVRS